MIQFNLLPAVKLEYIKSQRTKRLVITTAVLAGLITFGIFLILFINVSFVQKRHMQNLTNDIESKVAELQAIDNIDKVLTVQNQLNSLASLHESKPAAERTLSYLSKVTPTDATIAQSSVNFDENKWTVSGTAKSLVVVNKFVDTLKFTKYTVDGNDLQADAFSEVVLSSFSVDATQVTYKIDFKFNPEIFNNTKSINLVIPSIISTRSQTEKPSDLFQTPVETNPPAQSGN